MTSKMALGSVSTLALGALLIGAAPYLVSRTVKASTGAPWGAISGLTSTSSRSGLAATDASSEADAAQLLKLASLKTAAAPVVTSPPAPADTAPAAVDAPTKVDMAAADDTLPAGLPMDSVPLTATAPAMQAVSQSDVDMHAAAIAPASEPARPASSVPRASTAGLNINTASADALDHLPGVGRVSHTIMIHRPYHDVTDLVRKRVLRMSDFQKIQSRIRVD